MRRGKLIVIYGINNLGKSTQAKLLVHRINQDANSEYLKYPLYDFEPTGPMIDAYLRKGNPQGFSPREFQMLQVLNRTHFDETLFEILHHHHVVAEDYIGTGIAWGVGAGVDGDFLTGLNTHLIQPDIAFLFDGKRFDEGREKSHTHESNDDLTERVRLIHLDLARKFGWHIVNANRPKEEIHEEIWSKVRPLLGFLADDWK